MGSAARARLGVAPFFYGLLGGLIVVGELRKVKGGSFGPTSVAIRKRGRTSLFDPVCVDFLVPDLCRTENA